MGLFAQKKDKQADILFRGYKTEKRAKSLSNAAAALAGTQMHKS